MLYISRKVGQSLYIVDLNNEILAEVKIQPQRRRGQVSIGLNFSDSLKVIREEKLFESIGIKHD